MAFQTDLARKSWESVEAAQLAVGADARFARAAQTCRSVDSTGHVIAIGECDR